VRYQFLGQFIDVGIAGSIRGKNFVVISGQMATDFRDLGSNKIPIVE